MRLVSSALLLLAATAAAPALAEGFALREADAHERAAVETVLRANLPEGAEFLEAGISLTDLEPKKIGRACGVLRVETAEGGTAAIPYAVALGWTRTGEPMGLLISMAVDQMGPEGARQACAEIGVTL